MEYVDLHFWILTCKFIIQILATWVDRFSVDSGEDADEKSSYELTPTQNSKFSHFFTALLDHDQDNLISEQDFETLIEVSKY